MPEELDLSGAAGKRIWRDSKSSLAPRKLRKKHRYTSNNSRCHRGSCLRTVSVDSSASLPDRLPRQRSTRKHIKSHRSQVADPMDAYNWAPKLQRTSAHSLSHRRSRQQKEEDNAREDKIRAMSMYAPRRSTAGGSSLSRRLTKNSMRLYPNYNHEASSRNSLQLTPSISSFVYDPDCTTTYVLSGFELLSARPKIKYITKPRNVSLPPVLDSERSAKRKRRTSAPDKAVKSTTRVHDLANSLNARELRELMERDQKRRDRASLVNTMARNSTQDVRQERPKTMEVDLEFRPGRSLSNKKRALKKENITAKKRILGTTPKIEGPANSWSNRNGNTDSVVTLNSSLSPIDEPRTIGPPEKMSNSVLGLSETVGESAEVMIMDKFNTTSSRMSWWTDILSKKASLSQILLPRKTNQAAPILSDKPADDVRAPSADPPQSWTSFFKLRSRDKRILTPVSFSSVSRNSLPLGQSSHVDQKPSSKNPNIPRRTVSKFREDLPELPISPPDSRVQSPEAEDSSHIPRISERYELSSAEDLRTRYDTPCSGYTFRDAIRRQNETPTSSYRTAEASSPEPHALSQSLASIDSEASWLSGGKVSSKRCSQRTHQRSNDGSLSQCRRYHDLSESTRESGSAKDDNFSRLSPLPIDQHRIQLAWTDNTTGTLLENTKWGAVARRPNVVHGSPSSRKSRECLLNSQESESDLAMILTLTDVDRNSPVCTDITCGVQRALSLDSSKKFSKLSLGEEQVTNKQSSGLQGFEKNSREVRSHENILA
ncbi:hypothetical protein K3495_g7009 [Podosphaera aphanis]|nr:hypothetical protein K3495_g7009 [Podosphaera aphanis]